MTVTCCIPFCGRTSRDMQELLDDMICSACWKKVSRPTKQALRRQWLRYRRVDTTMRQQHALDPHRWKPGITDQAMRLEKLFHKRFATVVDRCKQEIMGI